MTSAAGATVAWAQRSLAWLRSHPRIVDVIIASLLALFALADLSGQQTAEGVREPDAVGVLLIMTGAAALVWRRIAPLAVLVLVVGISCVFYARDYQSFMAAVGLAAIYAVAAHETNRRLAWFAVVGAYALLFGVACFTVLDGASGLRWSSALSMSLTVWATIVAGAVIRNKEEIFTDTQKRAERAEADRQVEAERAVTRERLRIAREMHDVVAHGMSLITVQAAAAQEIAHADADRAISLMNNVEATSREALNEMRRMLGALRNDGDAGAGLTPQPTLRDVDDAVAQSNASGTATEFEVTGDSRPLAPGIELTAFRIVQEALTNVRKHAGATASAVVRLNYEPASLVIEVVDDGTGALSALSRIGEGDGLIGMRERVEIYNGDFSAGPRVGGGYRVRVRLPIAHIEPRASVTPAVAQPLAQPKP